MDDLPFIGQVIWSPITQVADLRLLIPFQVFFFFLITVQKYVASRSFLDSR